MKDECLALIGVSILLFIYSVDIHNIWPEMFIWGLAIILIYLAIRINERYKDIDDESKKKE
jgi:hypothetical protein